VIGSGPIVIGQACEFDYAGSQALKVLREEGYRTVVVNSNPATIMTDPGFADRTYLEPLDLEGVASVLERERPDALLPTLGGQTALNLASELAQEGVLDALGVELIGAGPEVIRRAEDRELFRATVESAGLRAPASRIVTSSEQLEGMTPPLVVRPAFTLGGHGGGFVESLSALHRQVERGLKESPIGQVLVEESVRGWDEFELEVMRDRADNVVVVCSIENLDPMGVHTGDSVTVAPQMTLSDEAYQELRDAAARVIRAVGVETGGSNIQFARDRETGAVCAIEMNPRVSRSSALASKATGYPIAKVAARLAVGYTLDEIPNDLTQTTPASFEPTLDYVVVKVPRFAFEKFHGADRTLGTQMKSVGEAMGIGRTFTEALLKAMRSRELERGAVTPWPNLCELPVELHPWFRVQVEEALEALRSERDLLALKRAGWSDAAIGVAWETTEEDVRACRREQGVRPVYRRVDSCAAEVEARSNYLYSTWGEADEGLPASGAPATGRPAPGRSVVILGAGPNRIGQGIEFDYCCVHAARTFRALGYEAVMVNCNPETVSTDYDTSDRLYFEPLRVEEVLEILERERPAGVAIQFGGQTPLRLARAIEEAGFRILGTPFEAVDLAEDRERFATLCDELSLVIPPWGIARSRSEALRIAERVGYPVLIRPSYVLGGRAMRVCYGPDDVPDDPGLDGASILVDRFLEGAVEIDVDALCDGIGTYVAAIMQHVEEAGVHSGDSSCVLPPTSLSGEELAGINASVRKLAPALGVVGLVNVQLALADGKLSILEANPRASRTVPFASKAIGVNLVEAACRLAAGERLHDLGLPPEGSARQVRRWPPPRTSRPRSPRPSAPPGARFPPAGRPSSPSVTRTSRR
jgi:carbamoyl-phosphate synthase large subunit